MFCILFRYVRSIQFPFPIHAVICIDFNIIKIIYNFIKDIYDSFDFHLPFLHDARCMHLISRLRVFFIHFSLCLLMHLFVSNRLIPTTCSFRWVHLLNYIFDKFLWIVLWWCRFGRVDFWHKHLFRLIALNWWADNGSDCWWCCSPLSMLMWMLLPMLKMCTASNRFHSPPFPLNNAPVVRKCHSNCSNWLKSPCIICSVKVVLIMAPNHYVSLRCVSYKFPYRDRSNYRTYHNNCLACAWSRQSNSLTMS